MINKSFLSLYNESCRLRKVYWIQLRSMVNYYYQMTFDKTVLYLLTMSLHTLSCFLSFTQVLHLSKVIPLLLLLPLFFYFLKIIKSTQFLSSLYSLQSFFIISFIEVMSYTVACIHFTQALPNSTDVYLHSSIQVFLQNALLSKPKGEGGGYEAVEYLGHEAKSS